MKICKFCNIEKQLSAFTINKTSKTGKVFYKLVCKSCMGVYKIEALGRKNTGCFKKGNIPKNRKFIDGRQSLRARSWSIDVIERDGECRECFSSCKLHAHHKKGWDEFPELRFKLDNGVTLCSSCHAKIHGREVCNLLKNGTSWAKGKKFSAEYRKKLSDAHKGKVLSEETKKKLSIANKGRKMSLEARRKLSKIHTGMKHTEESKIKMSESRKRFLAGDIT